MTDDTRGKDGWPYDVPLPFQWWKANICPNDASLASCLHCEHSRGVRLAYWPGKICAIYDDAAWRAYLATLWRAKESLENKAEDTRHERDVMAALCEVQRAAGNAGMAYLSGDTLEAHIRRIRDELDRLEHMYRKNGKARRTGSEGH